jgi:hypothetical protein
MVTTGHRSFAAMKSLNYDAYYVHRVGARDIVTFFPLSDGRKGVVGM